MHHLAVQYIKRIRNTRKQDYAKAYAKELESGIEVNDQDFTDVSFMVKQAVWMVLDDIRDFDRATQ